jgi:D,D-heptose 1,7-bisphosphate phosphatase
MHKAVFLDKDGTLIDDLPYNIDQSLITWKEGVFEALSSLSAKGYLLVIVTNQSGVARGLFEEKDLKNLEMAMRTALKEKNIHLDGFYYSPYHIDGVVKEYAIPSDCRKPGTGMLIKAATELQIDLSASWMIGDTLSDVEAGNKAGCKTILITDVVPVIDNDNQQATYIATTITEAANYI